MNFDISFTEKIRLLGYDNGILTKLYLPYKIDHLNSFPTQLTNKGASIYSVMYSFVVWTGGVRRCARHICVNQPVQEEGAVV